VEGHRERWSGVPSFPLCGSSVTSRATHVALRRQISIDYVHALLGEISPRHSRNNVPNRVLTVGLPCWLVTAEMA
jgi:hypothetical protein